MLRQEPIDHDEACAQEVGKRLELGCFEEQLIAYATCYKEKDETKYFISETAVNVYQFSEEKRREDIYCLPLIKQTKSMLIPSGKRYDLMQVQKLETGKYLIQQGGSVVADRLHNLAPRNNSSAALLIDQMKESLIGCFDENQLQIFEGFVDTAYFAKKLTAMEYLKYREWLAIVRETAESESIVHDVHERIYSGFSYLDEHGTVKYYYNAVKENTMERMSELRRKKLLTTPIVEKRYCFNRVEQFDKVIEDFKQLLRNVYNDAYWNLFIQLYRLPNLMDRESFFTVYAEAEEKNDRLLLNALNEYGVVWQVWDIEKR